MPPTLARSRPPRRPLYQVVADDVLRRLTEHQPPRSAPRAADIARTYRIPIGTAEFVRRAVNTRLRPLTHHPTEPGGGATAGFRPAWLRVADDLRDRVRTGHLRGRLPARAFLAAQYGVCVETVSKAVQALIEEALLATAGRHHRTYVPESS
ncbi:MULTISPECIES: GntR family transcriptional regulator [unclassified Streptomyces]|uniref:GntR family transcriptional regulator n=1 Tax=unclassified Streptomyces TaxID=2593676 RepID=UPI00352CAB65